MRRVVDERLGDEAMPLQFIEERLAQAAFGKREEKRLHVPRQAQRQAEHLPLGPAEERGRCQMSDAHPCTSLPTTCGFALGLHSARSTPQTDSYIRSYWATI